MLARDVNIVAIDFETTGQVQDQLNIPWQIGAVCIMKGLAYPKYRLSKYLRVPADYHFNPYTPGRWAELRNVLAECSSLQEEWPVLKPWLSGHCLLAHNVPTERKMLGQAFPMHEFGPWIDTLRIVRIAYPELESHALSDVLDYLKLTDRVSEECPDLAPHDACYDAMGCAFLFEYLISLPQWHDVSVEYLAALK